jgi:hypothetical protein
VGDPAGGNVVNKTAASQDEFADVGKRRLDTRLGQQRADGSSRTLCVDNDGRWRSSATRAGQSPIPSRSTANVLGECFNAPCSAAMWSARMRYRMPGLALCPGPGISRVVVFGTAPFGVHQAAIIAVEAAADPTNNFARSAS